MSKYAKKIREDYKNLSLKAFNTKYPGLGSKNIIQLSDDDLEKIAGGSGSQYYRLR